VYQAGIMRWPFPAGSALTTIEVTPGDATMIVGEELEFTATGRDQSGAIVALENPTWSLGQSGSGSGSFDPTSGSATTTFTATTAGTRLVVCSDGDVTGGALVTITDPPQLTTIEIDPASITVAVDGQVMFTAAGKDQYGEDFALIEPVWSVSGAGDGSFEPTTGNETTFTASFPGDAVVTCSQGDVSGTAEVGITGDDPRLATIELSPTSARIRVGDEIEFTAIGSDQYGRAFSLTDPAWRVEGDGDGSLDPATGTTATFTASTAGSVQVICSEDGVEGAATVEISNAGLPAPRRVRGRVAP
jgi:plastocyanin